MQYRKRAGWSRLSTMAAQFAAFIVLVCGITTAAGAAATLYVSNTPGPGEYESIGAACNAASDGDTILIKDGAYSGHDNIQIGIISNLPNVTIASVNGASHVTIDLQGSDPAFYFSSGNNSATKIQGLTIENGNSKNANGGVGNSVIQCATGSSPVISQCVFQNNTAEYNGFTAVVYFGTNNASPTFTQCQFLNNTFPGGIGGALYIGAGSVTVSQCLFDGNSTDDPGGFGSGGAIAIGTNGSQTHVTLINDVFRNNVSGLFGAAIYEQSGNATDPTIDIENCSFNGNRFTNTGSDFVSYCAAVDGSNGNWTINNSILYGDDTTAEFGLYLAAVASSTVRIQNSDIQGGYSGTGNIDADPLYLFPGSDLRLSASSPAINAGVVNPASPAIDFLGRARDAHIDMGAYEFAVTSAPVAVSPVNVGDSFTALVAAFSDNSGKVSPSTSYSASIDWGDSTTSTGTITHSGGMGTVYAVSGTHTYDTSGSKTVTVTITTNSPSGSPVISIAATSVLAHAIHLEVSGPSSISAGTSFSLTVIARDDNGNTVTDYDGTVHFTSTDPQAVLPADATTASGTGIFQVTLKTAGPQTITATDTANPGFTGTVNSITVTSLSMNHFAIATPVAVMAGVPFTATVTARDQYENVAAGYNGTLLLASSSVTSLPSSVTLVNGAASISAMYNTTGTKTIIALDPSTFIGGFSNNIQVNPGPVSQLAVSAPSTATAGSPATFTVTAQDALGNTATSYTGAVHFTSTDPNGILPADAALTNGTGSFSATFNTAASETLRARDIVTASITGTAAISVSAGAVTHLTITAPSTAAVGTVITATVTAKDALNNTATGYTGTVHLTSTDTSAVLPANFTLTSGAKQVSIKLMTPGVQTVRATDTVNSGLTVTTGNITVGTTAAKLVITGPATATAGLPATFTVTAKDTGNNTVSSYTGTVHITSTDTQAVLPADATLTNGVGTFTVTLKTATTVSIVATDTVTTSIKGSLGGVVVSAGMASQFVIVAPVSTTSGAAFYATVTAKDAYGNLVKSYAGTVHFTSSDLAAVLPADVTLTNGARQVSVKLKTKPSQTITATDAANGITATSGSIAVN